MIVVGVDAGVMVLEHFWEAKAPAISTANRDYAVIPMGGAGTSEISTARMG